MDAEPPPERPRWSVTVRLTGDRRHLPYLMAGLGALAERGEVDLALSWRGPRWRDRLRTRPEGPTPGTERVGRPYPWSFDLDVVDHRDGVAGRAAVDLQDWRDLWSRHSLRTADVVHKRMYVEEHADLASRALGSVVVPAGMTHGAPLGDWARGPGARASAVAAKVESVVNDPRRLLAGLPGRRRPEGGPGSPGPARRPPPSGPFTLFQVVDHAWGPGSEAERLTRERASVVRALRAELGDRFVGGIVFPGEPPADLADCASPWPSDRASYLELVAGAAVVVSTNGFGGSPPWKLAEYLEAGAAIVAERPEAVLPTEPGDGEALRWFRGPEAAASACADLLDDPATRARLGSGASTFYREHVSPEAVARRVLVTTSRILGGGSPCG